MKEPQENLKDILTTDHNLASLMVKMNAFVSIKDAEIITTLDKTTQYRMRLKGKFPQLVTISSDGRRKGYRITELQRWLKDPTSYTH